MALKNTYAKLGADKYISLTQQALVKAGASGVQYVFEEGRIVGLMFSLKLGADTVNFKLPINWRNFQNVLRKEDNRRADEDDYAYKVAWACTKDWIEAQMAFVESENVTVPQVFLPFAVAKDGKTLYEKVAVDPGFLLSDGK